MSISNPYLMFLGDAADGHIFLDPILCATGEESLKIVVEEDPEMSARFPEEWPVQVRINMHDGTVLTRRIDKVKWSDSRPPSWDELVEKFHAQVDPVIGESDAERAVDIIANIKDGESISPLMNLLREMLTPPCTS